MSSKSKSSKWSEWAWDEEYGRYKRWRYDSKGKLAWDWEKLPDENTGSSAGPLDSIQETDDGLAGLTNALEDTNIEECPDVQYDPSQSKGKGKGAAAATTASDFGTSPTYDYGSGSQAAAGDDGRSNRRNMLQSGGRKIRDIRQDKRYVVHRSKDFKFGTIFKVYWSEPKGGNGGTEITEEAIGPKGESFGKVRPFMVVNNKKGHSWCLPILTYGGQGCRKYGVHPEVHAVIYSSKHDPGLFLGENVGKKSIRVDITEPDHKLDPASRLNYDKVYTVEHNVRVFIIGRVATKYEQFVVEDFKATNPPIADRPYIETSDENTTRYAGEDYDTDYPTEAPVATSAPTALGWEADYEYPEDQASHDPNYTTEPQGAQGSQYPDNYESVPRELKHAKQTYEQEEPKVQQPQWREGQEYYQGGEGSSHQQHDQSRRQRRHHH